ncbi:MAG TPA: complex I NDUFA9 subunit family protein [Burkholderiales bacterium]|nr:complex I NDUFA9 subunit family protein [Burkholderiales bacterium]
MILNDVCVLGGSGFVGRHLCEHLVEKGLRVTVPTRDRERAKALILLPTVDVVTADVHDPEALARVTRGCDAVINLVGVLHGGRGKAGFGQAHVELARRVVDACRRNGIRRLVHMSALNAAPDAPSNYLRTKGEGERIVRESGLDFTIFRPSVIFGPEDRFLNLFAQLQRWLPVLFLGSPDARFQPVYVVNVAQAFAECLPRLESFGKSYDLAGPKTYTLRELVAYTGELTGHRRPIVGLGPSLSYLQAGLMELLPVKLLTRDNVNSMKLATVSDARLPFGIEPTALEAVAPVWLAQRTPRSRYNLFRDRSHGAR